MKFIALFAAAALVAASPVQADPKWGRGGYGPPGQMKKMHGAHAGPGASYYAPGHVKKRWGERSARRFAPGHRAYAHPYRSRYGY